MPHLRSMHTVHLATLAALALTSGALAGGRVIITEIMYNPNSKEERGQTEWIEIANVGDETIDIKDWRIDDEDRWDWGRFSCTLVPGEVAVLMNADYLTEAQFREAWDGESTAGASAYQVIGVNWGGIANAVAADNEILQLKNDKDEIVCEVQQQGQWPECGRPDGASIYLVNLAATDLSDGRLWKRSDKGVAGARSNVKGAIFNGNDVGSPGFVPGLDGGAVAAAPRKPPVDKPSNKTGSAPAASQPTSRPDNKIDY